MKRIAIAGFQHETNSFAPAGARYEDFVMADSWPGMLQGDAVLDVMPTINLPIGGAILAARAAGDVDLRPILWCAAEPSAEVEDAAFERIAGAIVEGAAALGPLDGLYLDLHGAMATTRFADGEGELLSRLRARLGPDLPIAISLDLHANLSPAMARLADAITIFRTYPHLDMAATGARAMRLLLRMTAGWRPARAFRQADFVAPLPAQWTGAEPARGLYAALPEEGADLALGFPACDTPAMGPALVAYAEDQAGADRVADALSARLAAAESQFDGAMLAPDDAVARALAAPLGKPVILADVQDNPGGGATSDTTGLLRALVEGGARDAVLGLLADPEAAARAHALGVGGVFEAALGGRSGVVGDRPYQGRFRVDALADGRFAFMGAMYEGAVAAIGPTALLSIIDERSAVAVAVSSLRCQALDRACFAHLGVDLEKKRLVALKSTLHFRADFDPIAGATHLVEAPGALPCRPERLTYRRLRPGVRTRTPGREGGASGPQEAGA